MTLLGVDTGIDGVIGVTGVAGVAGVGLVASATGGLAASADSMTRSSASRSSIALTEGPAMDTGRATVSRVGGVVVT